MKSKLGTGRNRAEHRPLQKNWQRQIAVVVVVVVVVVVAVVGLIHFCCLVSFRKPLWLPLWPKRKIL